MLISVYSSNNLQRPMAESACRRSYLPRNSRIQSSRNPCFEHTTDPHTLLRLVLSSCNMRELKHVLSELGYVMDLYRTRQEQLSIAYNVISNRNVTCNGSSSAQFYKSDAESKAGIMNYGRCVNNSHNLQSLAAPECSSILSNG